MENRHPALNPSSEETAVRQSLRSPIFRDLWLLFLFGLCMPLLIVLPVPLLRVPLGIFAVLFVPGYAITTALFARNSDIDATTRTALSIGVSAGILPFVALILDVLPWGIQLWPMVIALMSIVLVATSIGLFRRLRLPATDAHTVILDLHPLQWWRTQRLGIKLLLSGGILFFCSVIAYGVVVLALPDPESRLTEFYILGASSQAQDYPRETVVGQPMTVTLGITNHEGEAHQYHVEIHSGIQIVAQTNTISLADGATHQQSVQYILPTVGDNQRIDILLYISPNGQPYRNVQLYVNVKKPVSS